MRVEQKDSCIELALHPTPPPHPWLRPDETLANTALHDQAGEAGRLNLVSGGNPPYGDAFPPHTHTSSRPPPLHPVSTFEHSHQGEGSWGKDKGRRE